MGRTLLAVLVVLLALGLVVAGCRKDNGSGDGGSGGYLPAPAGATHAGPSAASGRSGTGRRRRPGRARRGGGRRPGSPGR
jgi:hypothetical protein